VIPDGYDMVLWRTSDLVGVTAIAFDDSNRLFAAQSDGRILLLEDADHNGFSEGEPAKVFATLPGNVNGLHFRAPLLYVSNTDRIVTLEDTDGDDVADVTTEIVTGLPFLIHWANGLTFGPDDKLYFALGSTCDGCTEADARSASILRCDPDGSNQEIFASGIRNCYDLAFNAAGHLFAGDNSFNDGSTPSFPPDELNWIQEGNDYGWPAYAGVPPAGTGTIAPVSLMAAHGSPNGISFYQGLQFPGMQDEGLIAEYGIFGFNISPQPLLRLNLQESGGNYTAAPATFVDGFLRPLDVAVNEIGELYIADFGVAPFSGIYRLFFRDLEACGDFSLGGSFTMTLRGSPGDFVVVFASLGTDHLPLGQNGVFRLDPAAFFKLFQGTLLASGRIDLNFTVPQDPSLIDLTVHQQMARVFNGQAYFGVRSTLTVEP
jgi:glucose/arabinose dehydrogenase